MPENLVKLPLSTGFLQTYMMPTESRIEGIVNTEKINPRLTATIVKGYVRHNGVRPEQLSVLITSVHQALGQLGQPVQPEEVRVPAVSIRRSVHRDYVVCLDCGYRGKTLRRHISTRHGFNRDEYLKRWGLRSDHPLTAPAYSERRSTLAKSLGLGRKRTAQATTEVSSTAAPTPVDDQGSQATPTRRRRSRAASGSADVASEAVAATPARKRRPRSPAEPPKPEEVSSPTVASSFEKSCAGRGQAEPINGLANSNAGSPCGSGMTVRPARARQPLRIRSRLGSGTPARANGSIPLRVRKGLSGRRSA
jgi:predicted transcriptional regulator